MYLRSVLFSVVALAIFMNGCSSKEVQARNSGFLTNYEGLEHDKNFKAKKYFLAQGANLSSYENVDVVEVQVISGLKKEEQTQGQKELYQELSSYLTKACKTEVSKHYTLGENGLNLEIGVSAVEVHFDDKNWYPYTPIELGVSIVSMSAYMDEAVRLVLEVRLVDAKTHEVLYRSRELVDKQSVGIKGDMLTFSDLEPALTLWLKDFNQKLTHLKKGN